MLVLPVVGLAVEIGTPVPKQNGNYTIPMSFVLAFGIVDVCELRLVDDLTQTFGEGKIVSVTPPMTTGTLKPNPDFDGVTDTNLLISDCNDATAAACLRNLMRCKTVIEVRPTPGVEVYSHSASISAKSSDLENPSARIPVTDVSTAGPEPDVNKNNNVEEGEPNIIELKLEAEVDVDLRASIPTPKGDGSETEILGSNTGNLSLSNVDPVADLAKMFPDGFEIWARLPVTTRAWR